MAQRFGERREGALSMDSSEQPVTNDAGPSGRSNKTLIRVGGVVAIVLVVGLIAWIVIDRSGNDSSTTRPTGVTNPVGPVAVSEDELSALAADVGHTVYWAGPIAGQTPEFTKTSSGRVYVRYLPKGVEAGDKRSNFLIVATYPFPNAYGALKKVANGKEVKIPGGGIALVAEEHLQSVHFAFKGVAYQGEVYDPSPEKSLKVATSGTVRPVP
jgi:hypothetical protein